MALISPRATSLPAPIVVPPSQSWDGNDGSWSTFSVNIGTPGQDFRLLVSTTASSIYVPMKGVCPRDPAAPDDCYDSRGILPFGSSQNVGFQQTESSTWDNYGTYDAALETNLGLNFNASYGFDTIRLGPSSDNSALALEQQNVGQYVDDRYWLGFIGLSTQAESFSTTSRPFKSLFGNLNESLVPSSSYSYGAGAPYGKRTRSPATLLESSRADALMQ
jgi:hypothetical protein